MPGKATTAPSAAFAFMGLSGLMGTPATPANKMSHHGITVRITGYVSAPRTPSPDGSFSPVCKVRLGDHRLMVTRLAFFAENAISARSACSGGKVFTNVRPVFNCTARHSPAGRWIPT